MLTATRSKKNRFNQPKTGMNLPWLRLTSVFMIMIIISVLFFLGHEITNSARFPIKSVQISGQAPHLNGKILQQKLAPELQEGFFGVNVDQVRKLVLGLDWIADVSVRKIWPDKLELVITEHLPLAKWNNNGLISERGVIFKPANVDLVGELPQFWGEAKDAQYMAQNYSKMQQLLQLLQLDIKSVTLVARGAWQLQLKRDLQIELGREVPLKRLERFVNAFPEIERLAQRHAKYVDLRYPNGMAIGWE